MKPLKFSLDFFQWTLIVLSGFAVIFSFAEATKYPVEISYVGFIGLLNFFEPFKILFAATFVVITANYSLRQMALMKESNTNFIKESRMREWISFLSPLINAFSNTDSTMCIDITRKLASIHDYLFPFKYQIKDKKHLEDFFNTFFLSKISSYEQGNLFWSNIGYYPDSQHSYSFITFQTIFRYMISEEPSYKNWNSDLFDLYLCEVRRFSEPLIDQKLYAQKASEFGMRFRFQKFMGNN